MKWDKKRLSIRAAFHGPGEVLIAHCIGYSLDTLHRTVNQAQHTHTTPMNERQVLAGYGAGSPSGFASLLDRGDPGSLALINSLPRQPQVHRQLARRVMEAYRAVFFAMHELMYEGMV